jgi:hypothetical protein
MEAAYNVASLYALLSALHGLEQELLRELTTLDADLRFWTLRTETPWREAVEAAPGALLATLSLRGVGGDPEERVRGVVALQSPLFVALGRVRRHMAAFQTATSKAALLGLARGSCYILQVASHRTSHVSCPHASRGGVGDAPACTVVCIRVFDALARTVLMSRPL